MTVKLNVRWFSIRKFKVLQKYCSLSSTLGTIYVVVNAIYLVEICPVVNPIHVHFIH